MAVASVPAAASATFVAGPNGKLAFASGRASSGIPTPDPGDADARIWVADYPGGTPAQVTTLPAGMQHRHPNWSPDHSKIVYAAGRAFSGRYALWIVDLRTGDQSPLVSEADGQDRPSWSPDGTRIAYGSGGKLFVKDVAGGSGPVQITNGTTDERPVWTQDGTALYFNRGPRFTTRGAGDKDIWRKSPVTPAGAETPVVAIPDVDDWQPALSPDGDRLCYLKGPQSDGADLWTATVASGAPTNPTAFATTPTRGELNCVWSPDGTRILYTLGAFGSGDLATQDVSGNDFQLLASMNVASHFEGNADWATNFSPVCDARDASVAGNGFVTVALACVDPDFGFGAAPPTPTPIESDGLEIVRGPAHGNVGSISNGRVIYTPTAGFAGTDSFTYTASDGTSTGTDADATSGPATVTVHVSAVARGGNGTGGSGGGSSSGGTSTDTTPPAISGIAVSPKRWRLGSALPHVARARARAAVGTTISFQLSEAGRATLAFQRASGGRRAGGRCVKPTRSNRSARRCTRFLPAGSIAGLAAKAGTNRVGFQGRLDRSRRLALGSYRVLVSAQDAAGNRASARTGPTFTIVTR